MKLKTKVELVLLAIILPIGIYTLFNPYYIGDKIRIAAHGKNTAMIKLADDAGMSSTGSRLFFRYAPKFTVKSDIEKLCNDSQNPIGCIKDDQIFILEPADDKEYNTAVVTAAHEMLHVAYARLSNTKRSEINELLLEEKSTIRNAEIKKHIALYDNESPEVQLDELFSIIGTEHGDVSAELDTVYSKYFTDRQIVVQSFQSSK